MGPSVCKVCFELRSLFSPGVPQGNPDRPSYSFLPIHAVCFIRDSVIFIVGEAVRSTCGNSHEEKKKEEKDRFHLSLHQTILWPYFGFPGFGFPRFWDSRILGFPDFQFPEFEFPVFYFPGFWVSQILIFPDFRFPEFWVSQTLGFPEFGFPGFWASRIFGFPDFEVPRFWVSRILGFWENQLLPF